jgi:hypothetical protein
VAISVGHAHSLEDHVADMDGLAEKDGYFDPVAVDDGIEPSVLNPAALRNDLDPHAEGLVYGLGPGVAGDEWPTVLPRRRADERIVHGTT